jgi:hypothetical protein
MITCWFWILYVTWRTGRLPRSHRSPGRTCLFIFALYADIMICIFLVDDVSNVRHLHCYLNELRLKKSYCGYVSGDSPASGAFIPCS